MTCFHRSWHPAALKLSFELCAKCRNHGFRVRRPRLTGQCDTAAQGQTGLLLLGFLRLRVFSARSPLWSPPSSSCSFSIADCDLRLTDNSETSLHFHSFFQVSFS